MSNIDVLKDRNKNFAKNFAQGNLAPLPKMNMIIIACADARVDPNTVLGLDLGEAVVMRNNGGRITPAIIEEITAVGHLVTKVTGQDVPVFHIMLMQHTKCGAQQFAAPDFQAHIKEQSGIDVSAYAIKDNKSDLLVDIRRLRDAPNLGDDLTVSAMLYDVETGRVQEIAATQSLAELRSIGNDA